MTSSYKQHTEPQAAWVARLRRRLPALLASALLAAPATAAAQTFESVGNRAQGMGGAFVAVADDATLTWWNPAGVAGAGQLSALFERGEWTVPSAVPPAGPAMRNSDTGFAFALPGFALSYYRVYLSEVRPTLGPTPKEDGVGAGVTKFALSQYGLTTGQSIGRVFTIASTLKLIRGGSTSIVSPGGDPFETADRLDVPVETKGDIDFGAMASLGPLRAGFTLKHAFEPEFQSATGPFVVQRQARLGGAYRRGSAGPGTGFTVAFDTDLTTTQTPFGDVRHSAAGAEARLQKWLGARGGFSWNTVGDARPSWSGGLSLGSSGLYLDGAINFGQDESKEGWNIGVRLAL